MSKNFDKILTAFPEDTNAVMGLKSYAEALDKAESIEKSVNSDGGKLILSYMRNETHTILDELLRNYRVVSRDDLVAICAALEQNLKIVTTLLVAGGKAENLREVIDTELKRIADGRPKA